MEPLLSGITVTQGFALIVGILAFAYMFKDQIFKLIPKSIPKMMNGNKQEDTIKDLLDFRSSYEKNSVVYVKLTEVIQALLKE